MGLKVGLQLRGSYFEDLSGNQKLDLLNQIPDLKKDPNYSMYRFHRTQFNKWVILNAFAVPMKQSKSIWSK